jgi:hypothetical protein
MVNLKRVKLKKNLMKFRNKKMVCIEQNRMNTILFFHKQMQKKIIVIIIVQMIQVLNKIIQLI